MTQALQPNTSKELTVVIDGVSWDRLPIPTHVITKDDDIISIVKKYATQHLQKNDVLFISERVVAITQGRAFKVADINPSWLARFLVRFVHKSSAGIGIGDARTMQLAIDEAGAPRILLGAFVAAITKLFGVHGIFYKVVGHDINAIDGPCFYTLPPYNEYAVLGPKNPNKVARELKKQTGNEIVIIDANDLGVRVMGKSTQYITDQFCEAVFKDNPLGQASEQTPLCIVREHIS